jgi:hypothetical protein
MELGARKISYPSYFLHLLLSIFWDLIKYDLKRILQYAQWSCKIVGSTNSSFLFLILKEVNPSTFGIFRPISLYNSSYKIMINIIANRMKNIMPKIIYDNQGRFMQNKHIIDNIVLM